MLVTFKALWKLLSPFHTNFYWYLLKVVHYEGIQIGESFIISLVVILLEKGVAFPNWVLLLVFLVTFDEYNMRTDNDVDWHIISKFTALIYEYLKPLALKKFLSLDISWHHNNNSGSLVGKVQNGVEKTLNLINDICWEFMPTLIQAILTLIPLAIISFPTAILSVIAGVGFMVISIKYYSVRKPLKEKQHDNYELEWHQGVELVQAVETVQIFGQEERLLADYDQLENTIKQNHLEDSTIGIFKANRKRIRLLTLTKRVILIFWIFQVYQGWITIPMFFFVYSLTIRLFSSFWRFSRLFERAIDAMEGIERLLKLLREQPTIEKNEHITPHILTGIPSIEFRNVCFSYQESYDKDDGALHDLTFEIKGGTVVALVGPSGSGKTTVRKLVNRLMDIQSGEILVDGVNVRNWNLKNLRSQIAPVPQGDDVAIFARTIHANILFGKPGATNEDVCNAAQMAGIHEFIMTLPDRYKTLVGEHGHKLSGGQKQRIALARAILSDRPILFFDEATNALDAITEHEIQSRMRAILQNKTAIIIAHRLSTIWDIADKIIVLNEGQAIEEGTHEQLVARKGLYSQMVELQLTS